MDTLNYSKQALAFASLQETPTLDLFHATLGVVSEVGEIVKCWHEAITTNSMDHTNNKEELGDICWFVNLACFSYGINFADLNSAIPSLDLNPLMILTQSAADMADQVKGEFIYGKGRDAHRMQGNLALIMTSVTLLAAASEVNLEQIMEGNIAKLTARYGEKYSAEAALNRDKDAERKAVEGA